MNDSPLIPRVSRRSGNANKIQRRHFVRSWPWRVNFKNLSCTRLTRINVALIIRRWARVPRGKLSRQDTAGERTISDTPIGIDKKINTHDWPYWEERTMAREKEKSTNGGEEVTRHLFHPFPSLPLFHQTFQTSRRRESSRTRDIFKESRSINFPSHRSALQNNARYEYHRIYRLSTRRRGVIAAANILTALLTAAARRGRNSQENCVKC